MLLPTAVKGLTWVTRNFHRLPARWRIVRWLERHEHAFRELPPTTVRVGAACRLHVNPADKAGRYAYVHGLDPRDWLSRIFARVLRPGDSVLDVGANMGVYTVLAARLVGPAGSVHAFEASPAILPQLAANVRLNRLTNVRIHANAVADRCGGRAFSLATPENTGLSSLRPLAERTAGVTDVAAIALDSLLDDLPPIRLAKLDVEGAEFLALQGMRELIRRDRPFIVLELTDAFLRELGADAQGVCAFLDQAGYEIFRIGARATLEPVATAPTEQCDIFARHSDHGEPLPAVD